jgi:hypothetical protein
MADRDGSRIVRIVLAGDSAGAVRAFREVDDASEGTTRSMEDHSARQTKALGRTSGAIGGMGKMALLAGATGVGALAYGMVSATKAAIGMGSQQALLQNSLMNRGSTRRRRWRSSRGWLTLCRRMAASARRRTSSR